MFKKVTFVIVGLLMSVGVALADLSVEWLPYTPPAGPSVTGFSLYKNDVKTDTFLGAAIVKGVSKATAVKGDSFTLTANFSDGSESPHSEPYVITWHGQPPFWKGIKFTR